MQHYFTEEDQQKFIEFLNSIANHAKFELNTKELCHYFKLLAYMQQTMLPKIEKNILEVKKVIQVKEEPQVKEKSKKAAKEK